MDGGGSSHKRLQVASAQYPFAFLAREATLRQTSAAVFGYTVVMTVARTIRARLLAWYDANARILPWRIGPGGGVRPDAYRVWLSEVMLQQTTVPHATPYFLDFLRRWPVVTDLAAAPDGEVMAAWAGLGYYARARNLLASARAVAGTHGGVFPDTEAGLLALPGVGVYTAAALAAIVFGRPANVVDGNVERVIARLYAVETAVPAAKPQLKRLAAGLVAEDRPGDWAQALMDLGAVICRPKAPSCEQCPLRQDCAAYASAEPQAYPRRAKRVERPHRHGAVFLLQSGDRVGLIRRPPTGLLGGMLALPSTEWRAQPWSPAEIERAAPLEADWRSCGEIEHVFTHFSLTLQVWRAETTAEVEGVVWTNRADLGGLPSVFLKAARAGLDRLV
jgi:A/G-specific adenine glycosylase